MADLVWNTDSASIDLIKTGLTELDKHIGGLGKGMFILIGGRPGMGKSQLAKQLALNVGKRDTHCGVVSIEESRKKIGSNIISNLSGVENHRIRMGRLDQTCIDAMIQAASENANIPIYIDDVALRMSEIEASIVKMVAKYKCEMVIVDFLQLIDPDNAQERENENRELTIISNTLKAIFKRLHIAGVCVCQLNRGGDSRDVRLPTAKDLRGSGSLEQNADVIILLHRNDFYMQNDQNYTPDHQIQAIIEKNKDNARCMVPLHFDGRFQRITDWNEGLGIDPNAPPPDLKFNPGEMR